MSNELQGSSAVSEGANSSPSTDVVDLREARLREALEHVRRSLADLRFGQVVVTVQDGVVVQIDRTEKTRLR